MSIQFPNLGINLDYVGKSIQIFGFEITFFGLIIALGMLLGVGFVILEAKRCGENKDEYLERLHDFIETLDNVEKVEVLPYHTLGVYKWKELGIPYQLEGIDPPSKERVENANKILETAKYHA